MANLWDSDLEVSEELAKKIVTEECQLNIQSLRPFGEGWDNRAFLVNDRFVFRFPRRKAAVQCLLAEIELLSFVDGGEVCVPKIEYYSKASRFSGQPFVGYEILSGVAAAGLELSDDEKTALSAPLGRFLRSLHSSSIPENLKATYSEGQGWRTDVENRVEKIEGTLASEPRLFQSLDVDISKITDLCRDIVIPRDRTLVHGDFYSLHYLVSNRNHLSAVIDWGDTHWGSPSLDLSVAFGFLPVNSLGLFESEYGEIPDSMRIAAAFRAFSHSAVLLQFCYRENKEQLLKETKSSIERAGHWLVRLLT